MVDTSSAKAPAPTVSLQEIDQTSRGEGQGLETVCLQAIRTLDEG